MKNLLLINLQAKLSEFQLLFRETRGIFLNNEISINCNNISKIDFNQ